VNGARQRFAVIITFEKSDENSTSATAYAENVALLPRCTQYTCGTC
jgi:hypothetical protein